MLSVNNELCALIDRLCDKHSLSLSEYELLIRSQTPELSAYAAKHAERIRRAIYGTDIYIRGLIEIGNVCRNDCFYCGIRKSNLHCERYVLTRKQILDCCDDGYKLGFRTFVLQSGENAVSVDLICQTLKEIKERYPDCAVTLSLGEYSREDYERMYAAGADRYLLRHETYDKAHYEKLHPKEMSFDNRIHCLYDLKDIGFQVGCGFMVGSPYQTSETLAKDLKFIEEFKPDMCGIGPFIPHKDTPFHAFPAGTAEQTVYLLSLIRLIHPNILLPATTALGTIRSDGRKLGIRAGANVIMPNLSPDSAKEKYTLYDNKAISGEEASANLARIKQSMLEIGYNVVTARGDVKK